MIHQKIIDSKGEEKLFALLLDPDKCDGDHLEKLLPIALQSNVTMLLVGGSLVKADLGSFISTIKKRSPLPVVIFPGNAMHFSTEADAILLLSLISGRNSDFLIGNHVIASNAIKTSGLEVLPTGYILIDGGVQTSVQYMSNTMPIPATKIDIAVATALAGEQLGLKMIYLEAGSGAKTPVPIEMIKAIRNEISIPLIVGGGLKTPEQVKAAWNAGADMVVVGNALENDIERLSLMADRT
ncbi:MAG: geranylgeranylglyceryl/heptaprenylglyceryl phosphate synthase [Bacteroidales bacterium]|nr:MAG: geranylgeranylglyceryl/heptaprenylglyceryl phosphate synthase [Bacteroidales bacterium]